MSGALSELFEQRDRTILELRQKLSETRAELLRTQDIAMARGNRVFEAQRLLMESMELREGERFGFSDRVMEFMKKAAAA